MKISLITTVKNEEYSIRDLVHAIQSQSRQLDEWVVVDGGSVDRTAAILREESNCKLLILESNISEGRNRAIAESKGDIIVVVDAGCLPAPNWLEALVTPLEQGKADFTAGPTAPRIQTPFDAAQWIILDQFYSPAIRWRPPTVSSRSLAFNRKVWEDCPYPEWLEIGEDRWLVCQWIQRGKRMLWVPEAKVEWRMRSSLSSVFLQHFRYMRGDGQGGLRTKLNLIRLFFYMLLILLVLLSFSHGLKWIGLALGIWFAYLGATNAARFPLSTLGRSVAFRFKTLGWTPLMLLGVDLAKITGYLVGMTERQFERKS